MLGMNPYEHIILIDQSSETEKLLNLRKRMKEYNVSAYIVPHNDAHHSEYIMESDERIKYISGFSGSAGTCVITLSEALLWVDSRYFIQAAKQVDPGWKIMKIEEGSEYYPEWLSGHMAKNSVVGVCALLFTTSLFLSLQQLLNQYRVDLLPLGQDLVDLVWPNKPLPSTHTAFVFDFKYTEETVREKILKIKDVVREGGGGGILICALDSICWTLNLRGSDIPFNPVFMAYLIITFNAEYTASTISLYSPMYKFAAPSVQEYMAANYINLLPYSQIFSDLVNIDKLLLTDLSECNYLLYTRLLSTKCKPANAPIHHLKMYKNAREIEGFRSCHIRDGLNLCRFLAWVENEIVVKERKDLNEWTAAEKMRDIRSRGDLYMGLSFETICSTGANGAIIHYSPSPTEHSIIKQSQMFLLDSGCQFLDGTTDVTRSVHWGTPTPFMCEMYTRVLMGNLDTQLLIYPTKLKSSSPLDLLTRRYLYQVGRDYGHGTGHGVGYFLNVHEGPVGISSSSLIQVPLADTVCSIEPGYYEEGSFGVRVENLVLCKVHPQYPNFLCFENLTMAPYCQKLIVKELLLPQHLIEINSYHESVKTTLLPLLGNSELDLLTKEYINRECKEIVKN